MLRNTIILFLTALVFSSALQPLHKPITKTILMKGMRFVPASLEVSIGDTVIWMNDSNGEHNVVANDGSFKSNILEKGQIYALVFEKKGSFKYYCQPHRIMGMKGIIEVK
ncbi:MAG: cupredoxin domain-containing protein [Chitinophagaceae bacterium]|nr:cupredoxin domain-containing protein [Chitinophagaceae bacterium]